MSAAEPLGRSVVSLCVDAMTSLHQFLPPRGQPLWQGAPSTQKREARVKHIAIKGTETRSEPSAYTVRGHRLWWGGARSAQACVCVCAADVQGGRSHRRQPLDGVQEVPTVPRSAPEGVCVPVCMYVYVCVYMCVCTCVHVCVHVCVPVCMYVYMCACMCTCVRTCVHVCTCVCTCVCVHRSSEVIGYLTVVCDVVEVSQPHKGNVLFQSVHTQDVWLVMYV